MGPGVLCLLQSCAFSVSAYCTVDSIVLSGFLLQSDREGFFFSQELTMVSLCRTKAQWSTHMYVLQLINIKAEHLGNRVGENSK